MLDGDAVGIGTSRHTEDGQSTGSLQISDEQIIQQQDTRLFNIGGGDMFANMDAGGFESVTEFEQSAETSSQSMEEEILDANLAYKGEAEKTGGSTGSPWFDDGDGDGNNDVNVYIIGGVAIVLGLLYFFKKGKK